MKRAVPRGSVLARGLRLTRDAEARVLRLWRPGDTVYEAGSGYILAFVAPRRMVAEVAPGTPLLDWRWSEAGGEVAFTPGASVDLSAWIALDLPIVHLEPLGAPPRAPIAAPPTRAVPEVLGLQIAPGRAAVERGLARISPWQAWFARVVPFFLLNLLGPLGLSALLAKRHLRWLEEVVSLFEAGKLEEALHRAIPLGGAASGGDAPPWALPGRRDRLEVGSVAAGRTTLATSPERFADLQAVYRRAHDRLIAEGRVEWAAFVLVELLNRVEEGVALLESHRLYAAAAEIGDRRELPAGRRVRLWFLAGDRARATDIARKTGCWHEAIAKLDGEDRDRFAAVWMDDLARRGELPEAVDVAWQFGHAEASRPWIEQLLETGRAGAQLPRWAALGEDPDARLRAIAESDPETCGGLWERRDAWPEYPGRSMLASSALRHAVAAHTERPDWLLDSADRVLAEDVRRLARPAPVGWPERVQIVPGPARILDLAPCGDGVLLAHGEAGVTWLRRDLRVGWRVDIPADHLVSGPDGTALAVALRGTWRTVHRIELYNRRATRWIDLAFTEHADRFDAGSWLVLHLNEILAIDPSSPVARHHWRVDGLGPLRDLRVRDRVTVLAGHEELSWRLPDLQAFRRAAAAPTPKLDVAGAFRLERNAAGIALAGESKRVQVDGACLGRFGTDAAWLLEGGGVGRLDLRSGAWRSDCVRV